MIKGVTSSGFKYEVDERLVSDWRIVKLLSRISKMSDEADEDDPDAIIAIIDLMDQMEEIMFKDKGKKFEKHILKHNDGLVAPRAAMAELFEIFKAAKESKNS